MKTTRRTLFSMLAALFAGFGAAPALRSPLRGRALTPTRFAAAEVAKASEAVARLAVASKVATNRLNELGVTVRASGNAYIKDGKLMFTTQRDGLMNPLWQMWLVDGE